MLTIWLNFLVNIMSKTKDTNTETTILNAAETIFQQKGMEGARMQEIADEAGINKALLHYYYRSKQLLFEAVFKSAFLNFNYIVLINFNHTALFNLNYRTLFNFKCKTFII